MTCIVGLEHEGSVYMGADSSISGDGYIMSSPDSKLWKTKSFVFGFAGDARAQDIVEGLCEYPNLPNKPPKNPRLWLVREFSPLIMRALKSYGGAELELSLLIGFQGTLWEMGSDFSFFSTEQGYTSIGGGSEYAMGALYAGSRYSCKTRLRKALEAAEMYSPCVQGPFRYLRGGE